MRRIVLALVIAAGCATASGDSSQRPQRFEWTYDNGITAAARSRRHPQPIDAPEPATAVAGAVRFCVGPTGSVTSAKTERSTGDAQLDEALRAAVLAWTFRPAEFGGLRLEACATATFGPP